MIGPDILRSIEMTETTVTAMTAEIARNKMKDTDVTEMHTEIGKSQKRKGGRPAGSLALTAGKIEKKNRQRDRRGGPGKTTDPGRNEDWEDRRPSRRHDENERPQGEWRQRTDNREEARTGRTDRRAEHRTAREDRGRGDRSRPPTQQMATRTPS